MDDIKYKEMKRTITLFQSKEDFINLVKGIINNPIPFISNNYMWILGLGIFAVCALLGAQGTLGLTQTVAHFSNLSQNKTFIHNLANNQTQVAQYTMLNLTISTALLLMIFAILFIGGLNYLSRRIFPKTNTTKESESELAKLRAKGYSDKEIREFAFEKIYRDKDATILTILEREEILKQEKKKKD